MKKEMAVIDVPENNVAQINPYDKMVEMALSSDVGIEKLEKLLELKERHEANEAKKAYHKAMAGFKSSPPEIDKDSNVNYSTSKGTTNYNHATLGNVATKINKALAIHGLSAGWKTDQTEGKVKVTCTITHELGYSEDTSLFSAPDSSGGKNAIQAIGSAVTYLQRYTILALTGLATKEQDNDGQSQPKEPSSLVKLSPEYKELAETKELFPDEYKNMIENFGGEPMTAPDCKVANDWIKKEVDTNTK